MGKKDNKYSNAATSLSEGGIFGLGRPIDFTDGITRIALICTILTSVAATFWKTMGGADTETAMYFGLNTAAAFFFSWLFVLSAVLLVGFNFILLTVTYLREKIVDALPLSLRNAIGAGIGLFIAFIGLQNAGIIVNNDANLIS